jgi:hypothetical protein
MTVIFDATINSSSRPKPAPGRYDRLQEAGLATRFVKGASGNPNGRPKKRSNEPRIKSAIGIVGENRRAP